MLTAGRHIAAEISFITAGSIPGYATGGMEEIYPEDAEPPEVTSFQTARQRPDMGLGRFNYQNLLNLFRRKLPMVPQNLREFGC